VHPKLTELQDTNALVADTKRGLQRLADLAAANEARVQTAPSWLGGDQALLNPSAILDDQILDPTKPEGLMYAHTDRGPVLLDGLHTSVYV
jgi:hypothetical protein